MSLTDDDIAAYERLLKYGVVGINPGSVSGASTEDVVDAALELLAEVKASRERERKLQEQISDLSLAATIAEDEMLRLREGIKAHRDKAHLMVTEGKTLGHADDEALWSLLDDTEVE